MHGQILGPFEAFLLMRGMRTLHVRVEAQAKAALTLAEKLKAHPLVADVLYPGLASHPQHAIAARQMTGGFGGMLSVRVKAGEQAAVSTAARVELWKRATSRSAASRASSSTAPPSRAPARPARRTCCACRSASRRSTTSMPTSTARCAAPTPEAAQSSLPVPPQR